MRTFTFTSSAPEPGIVACGLEVICSSVSAADDWIGRIAAEPRRVDARLVYLLLDCFQRHGGR